MPPDLTLGPLLRYVDDRTATVWVETSAAAHVEVRAGEYAASAPTFAVHGHHYALVDLTGLPSGSRLPYSVHLDGRQVWPQHDYRYPSPVIATLEPGRPLRMAFGSCRTSVSHDEAGNTTHGVDALRTYALRLAGAVDLAEEERGDPDLSDPRWPDLLLLLGDQVYADETTEEMRAFIASRRDIDEPPGTELQDYEEYAHIYLLAWSDPANRWLLSTVSSAMIFDDHDVRDDWNTSAAWKQRMEETSWWHDRIVAGLASYWVYQHAGNLSPTARQADPVWQEVLAHHGPEELDLSATLDAFAYRVDQEPKAYRWSFVRDFDTQARLVVVDSRAARVLDPEHRAMLDPDELAWLDGLITGEVDHLLIGTSLPFLMARGLHHVEAFSEALAYGAWGRRGRVVGERLRQIADLEHWPAFQDSFQDVARMVREVATGQRGRSPASVTFLSGDVHHSYVGEARLRARRDERPLLQSAVLQAVCSPMRNPLSHRKRFLTAALAYGVAGPIGRLVSLSAKVPAPPFRWRYAAGPWFHNNVAFLQLEGEGLRLWWARGEVVDGDHAHPRLRKVRVHRLGHRERRPPVPHRPRGGRLNSSSRRRAASTP